MGPSKRHDAGHERRRPDRPRNGDAQPCPHCHQGTLEFNERFRFDGVPVPAWTCDNPGCRLPHVLVRRQPTVRPTAKALVAASKQLRARARVAVIKSKATTERNKRGIARARRALGKRPKPFD